MTAVRNLPASVRQRLLDRARSEGRPFNELLQYYATERVLYRLSRSRHGPRFVLKGALLLRVWGAPVGRPTMDIDLLARTDNDVEAIERQVREVLREPVEEDGLVFDVESVEARRIVEEAPYHGVRVRFAAHLAGARVRLQIDIGFGDPVHPVAVEEGFPTLLQFPAPRLLCYSRESTVAEKFEAMVRHGALNSRMKDFYDVWLLSRSFVFDGPTLAEAIRRTFASRETDVAGTIAAFSESFALSKASQWKAFRRSGDLEHAPDEFGAVIRSVIAFLGSVVTALSRGDELPVAWTPPGPWQ